MELLLSLTYFWSFLKLCLCPMVCKLREKVFKLHFFKVTVTLNVHWKSQKLKMDFLKLWLFFSLFFSHLITNQKLAVRCLKELGPLYPGSLSCWYSRTDRSFPQECCKTVVHVSGQSGQPWNRGSRCHFCKNPPCQQSIGVQVKLLNGSDCVIPRAGVPGSCFWIWGWGGAPLKRRACHHITSFNSLSLWFCL